VEVRDGVGQLKGRWQVASIAGGVLSLEANGAFGAPNVAVGDRWQGVYLFDRVVVRGKARVITNDAGVVGSSEVAADSALWWGNFEAPTINPAAVHVTTGNRLFLVAGDPGAVTDPQGIASAKLRNLATGSVYPLVVAADGSFSPVAVGGHGGQQLTLEATDAHPRPRTSSQVVATLPANAGPPVVTTSLIAFAFDQATSRWHLRGEQGAVVDPEPGSVTATNTRTGQQFTAPFSAAGSFDLVVQGDPGDQFQLTATDGHPDPLSTTVSVGSIPWDNEPPTVNTSLVSMSFQRSEDLGFHVCLGAGAVQDPQEPIHLALQNQRTGQVWRADIASGAAHCFFLDVGVRSGDPMVLSATDSHLHPRTTTVTLGPLPSTGNAPPTIAPLAVSLLPFGFGYQVVGRLAALSDPDGPIADVTIKVQVPDSGWRSDPVQVRQDGSFYLRLLGNLGFATSPEGHQVVLLAQDKFPFEPKASELSLGPLPERGIPVIPWNLDGARVSRFSQGLLLLDGGSAVGKPGDQTAGVVERRSGLGAAKAVVINHKAPGYWVLDGAAVRGFVESLGEWRDLPLGLGVLVNGQVLGDELVLASQAPEGIYLIRLTLPQEASGTWELPCGDTLRPLLLPQSAGHTVYALLPAPNGQVAVLTDDPQGELRLVELKGPQNELAGTVDLPLSASPTWARWQDGELLLGLADGSLELWRWSFSDGGAPQLARLFSWQVESRTATAAVRTGDQLWVGYQDGTLQQLDLGDEGGPRVVGETNLGDAVVDIMRLPQGILVATSTALLEVQLFMPPTVPATQLDEGCAANTCWVLAGSPDVAAFYVHWDDGIEQTHGRGVFSRSGAWPNEVEALSEHWVATSFLQSGGFLRDFPAGPPSTRLRWQELGLGDACSFDHALGGSVWTGAGWAEVAVVGSAGGSEATYLFRDGQTGVSGSRPLLLTGPLVDFAARGGKLLAVSGDLQVWQTNPAAGGSVTAPVLQQQVELFGADPVAAMRANPDEAWLLAAANDPPRLARVRLPENDDEGVTVEADNVPLPGVEGVIRDLDQAGDELWVLTDAGTAGRIYRLDLANPGAAQLLGQVDLSPGAAATRLLLRRADATAVPQEHDSVVAVVVLREGWGVELFSPSLVLEAAVPLPGARDVAWTWAGVYVLCGDFGQAQLVGSGAAVTACFVEANGEPLGDLRRATSSGVLAADGIAFPWTFPWAWQVNPPGFRPTGNSRAPASAEAKAPPKLASSPPQLPTGKLLRPQGPGKGGKR
jgi:hypothetical protein